MDKETALITKLEYLKKQDPILKKVIATVPRPNFKSTENLFHDLISCVVEQQIHYRSTKNVFQKMLSHANLKTLTPQNFQEFEKRSVGIVKLSMKKQNTILNIIEWWNQHTIDWDLLSDEEVRNELNKIEGIGKWTVDMSLIYTLQRPDVFSFEDYHIKQVMSSLYELPPKSRLKAQMVEIVNTWKPYRSTAFLYLLEWKKQSKLNHRS